MKFEPTKDKQETLFQGFYLLLNCPTAKHTDEVCSMLLLMLADPEITKEHAETACARAIEAVFNEKQLEATFNG
jgi:hypothetical protein|tara:strand:- start:1513 stop:1734 length:222 start_codon:yes stop_codon:yes gene_type:complete